MKRNIRQPPQSPGTQLLRLLGEQEVIRSRDLNTYGIPRTYLQRLVREHRIERLARGLYALPNRRADERATVAEVAARIPGGVVCLLSALQFHGIGTQLPPDVWIAIDRKAWKPRVTDLPVQIVRFSGKALTEGVERHRVGRVPVQVYNVAKTVADCFKYRHKLGLDVALEALRDCRRRRRCSMDQLWHYARICRVAKVMQPYLEAIG